MQMGSKWKENGNVLGNLQCRELAVDQQPARKKIPLGWSKYAYWLTFPKGLTVLLKLNCQIHHFLAKSS
jgi:hypothetical protein